MRNEHAHAHEGLLLVPLTLKDRRGHKIRAKDTENLEFKVWTQDRNCYLTFDIRDVKEETKADYLVLLESDMNQLPAGVVIYSYTFSDAEESMNIGGEVITETVWRPYGDNDAHLLPSSYFKGLAQIKQTVDTILQEAEEGLGELRGLEEITEEEVRKMIEGE